MTCIYERHDEHHEGLSVNDAILVEVRELRTDFNRSARDTGERLARLESQLESVVGDKQPGRLTVVEHKVSDLEKWKWRMAGIATGVASAFAYVIHAVWK